MQTHEAQRRLNIKILQVQHQGMRQVLRQRRQSQSALQTEAPRDICDPAERAVERREHKLQHESQEQIGI